MTEEISRSDLLELATELTTAWLANPNTRVSVEEIPAFLEKMHGTVSVLATSGSAAEEAAPAAEYVPAVTARRSLASKDHIISMIDGKPYKSLKRHLTTNGITPAEYRERYGLKPDYPMVAENYAAIRRELAKKIGLGRKPGAQVAAKPAAKPAANADKAAASSEPKTDAKPVAKAAPGKTVSKASTKPAAKSATKPAAKPAAKPKAKAAAKPVPAKTAPAEVKAEV